MTNLELVLPIPELLGVDNTQDIDLYIDGLISKHSKNSEVMNLMALEATSLATSVESRSLNLEEQGFLKRGFNTLTGKNQKVSARNSNDLAQGQYLGQQMLNKLADNNLMTFQIVTALGDKLNRVAQESNETKLEVAQLNQTLANFFIGIRQKLESKFNALERNDNLLFWKETMMFEPVYQGRSYPELSRVEKVVCLANGFYTHSQQQWTPRDLLFLKSILVQVGYQPTELISLKEMFKEYQCSPEILGKLLTGLNADVNLVNATQLTPMLLTFNKFKKLEAGENNIVDTVLKYAPKIDRNDLILDLAEGYILQQSGRSLSCEISIFDAVMDLVEDLSIYKNFIIENETLESNNNLERDIKNRDAEYIDASHPYISIYKNYEEACDSVNSSTIWRFDEPEVGDVIQFSPEAFFGNSNIYGVFGGADQVIALNPTSQRIESMRYHEFVGLEKSIFKQYKFGEFGGNFTSRPKDFFQSPPNITRILFDTKILNDDDPSLDFPLEDCYNNAISKLGVKFSSSSDFVKKCRFEDEVPDYPLSSIAVSVPLKRSGEEFAIMKN